MVGRDGILGTSGDRLLLDDSNFSLRIGVELIDSHHHRDAVQFGVGNVLPQVNTTLAENIHILGAVDLIQRGTGLDLGTAAVNLQRTDSSHNHDSVRNQTRGAALDVKEALTTHCEVEASLGDHETGLGFMILIRLSTGKLQGKLIGDGRAGANTDVGKGTSVHHHRSALQTLHQIWLNGILHQGGKGTTGTNVVASHGVAVSRSSNNHTAQSLTHIRQIVT